MDTNRIKYVVNDTHLGSRLYDGFDEVEAYDIAEKSLDECVLYVSYCGEIVAESVYSPSSGWHNKQ
jgi:hypothetical protein